MRSCETAFFYGQVYSSYNLFRDWKEVNYMSDTEDNKIEETPVEDAKIIV